MIFQYIFIFIYFLLNAFEANGKIFPLNKNVDIGKIRQSAPCSSYYGLFFFDNTVSGHNTLSNQIAIADFFFDYSILLNYSASVTITSQSNTSVTNNFKIVEPGDYATFNLQITHVMNQLPSSIKISYFDLVLQALQFDFYDTSRYSSNPVFIFLVNSEIDNIFPTIELLQNLQMKNQNKVKILGISMDPNYSSQTARLVDSMDNVYTFNETDPERFTNINAWILQQACSFPIIPTATTISTTTTTPSPPCNGYINLVVDGSSSAFTSIQYQSQVNLIENFILPMWNDFSKFSTMIMYDQSRNPYTVYNNSETLNSIKKFIHTVGKSSYNDGLLYEVLYPLVEYNPFAKHRSEMSTFIFLTSIYDDEINHIKDFIHRLTKHGKLNIIGMGNNISVDTLKYLNVSSYYIWDYSDNQISSIQQFFRKNIKCL